MKKILRALIILFILYYVYELVFTYFQGGHEVDYIVESDDLKISINEKSYSRLKRDLNYYKFTVDVNDSIFKFHSYDPFESFSYVIDSVKYFKDDKYECIYTKFKKEEFINDVLCKDNNGIQINYSLINDASDDLKKFVDDLVKDGYDRSSFKTSKKTAEYFDIDLYVNNIIPDHFVGLSFNNGLFRINRIDKVARVIDYESEIPLSDVRVSTYMENMFFTFDYSKIENTLRIFSNNVTDKNSKVMIFNIKISPKTFMLGRHGTSIYVFDPESKKEYEIDYSNDTFLEVGNEETGILYYDGDEKKRCSITNLGNAFFIELYKNDYYNGKYSRIDKVGYEHGFYYLYERVKDGYLIYRVDINDKDTLTYIGKTSSYEKVTYSKDYIYYTLGDKLYVYGDKVGSKIIASGNSLIGDVHSKLHLYIK